MELILSQKMIYSILLLIIGVIVFVLINKMGIIGVANDENIKREAGKEAEI